MPLARRLAAALSLVLFLTTLLSFATSLAEGELPRESAEREATARRRSPPPPPPTTTADDAPSSSSSLFLPLSSFPSSTVRGSTLRRHASHRIYSPLWLHAGTFYALDERGSFPGDASAHVAGAATRVEALPTASAAELAAASFPPASTPWLPTPALLLEIPWPAHVDSTAVWMEIVAGAAAAVREAMDVERAEMQQRERRRRQRRRPGLVLLDLVLRPFSLRSSSSAPVPSSPAPPPPLFPLPDPSSSGGDRRRRREPLPLAVLLPNLDAETWASSPGARWAREEALPMALEAAAEVALHAAAAAAGPAAADGGGSGGGEQQQQQRQQEQQRRQQPFFSLSYLTRDDLEQRQRRFWPPNSERAAAAAAVAPWIGFEAVVVPHGRSTTPRRDAGFGRGGGGGGGEGGGGGSGEEGGSGGLPVGPGALAAAFRRRAWEAAGLPLGPLLLSASSSSPAEHAPPWRVERGCDPRSRGVEGEEIAGGGGGGGGAGGGGGGARDIVLVSEPSPSENALANYDELAAALERAAISLGLRARPALLTPSTSLASAAKVAARSRVVVGRTGPALAALAPLLAPGSGVVELVPPNWEWEGSHLLIRNLTRPLFGSGGRREKSAREGGVGGGGGGGGGGIGVLYSSWRPGELPSAPAAPRALVYASEDDRSRFGRWSARECAHDRECTEATARGSLAVDVAAVVDEVALLAAPLLPCDNVEGF